MDRPETAFPLEEEYGLALSALERTGVLAPLPETGTPGVVGIDGQEYPVPTMETLQAIFSHNRERVERKTRQGFTRLLLTPLAMPVPQLLRRVETALRERAASGRILANAAAPIWVWERVRKALDTHELVYFPLRYTDPGHQGSTKEEVVRDLRFCAVAGWSVGLVEPVPVMPRPGQGEVLGGRRQLEAASSPREYLQTLSAPVYEDETGWTPEDFLTHFLTQLETTGQVGHDRCDGNALWLLGTYLPHLMPTPHLVPVGYGSRDVGRKMYLTAHRTGNRLKVCVARTVVRLGP